MSTTVSKDEQRRRALTRANQTRLQRARERRQLRAMTDQDARSELARLLAECPDWIAREAIHIVLMWLPRCGPRRSGRLLNLAGVSGLRSVADLTARQRAVLTDALTTEGDR